VRFDADQDRLAVAINLIQAQFLHPRLASLVQGLQGAASPQCGCLDPATDRGAAGAGSGGQEHREQAFRLVEAQAQGRSQGGEVLLLGHRQVDGVFQFLPQLAVFRAYLIH